MPWKASEASGGLPPIIWKVESLSFSTSILLICTALHRARGFNGSVCAGRNHFFRKDFNLTLRQTNKKKHCCQKNNLLNCASFETVTECLPVASEVCYEFLCI